MRTVIIGAQGQLGSELARRLDTAVPLGRAEIDIADAASVQAALDARQPQLVINAAAYNLVDRAEEEPERALAVNADGPRYVARWCAGHDAALVHVSSDYVFGADSQHNVPYTEEDPPGPLSAYGRSKLAGELFVREECPRHFVVRTCGLYGRSPTAEGNFVSTMLRLGRERDELRIVDDQRCTPTSVADLADAHGADGNRSVRPVSRHQRRQRDVAGVRGGDFRIAGLHVRVVPITSADYGACGATGVQRPRLHAAGIASGPPAAALEDGAGGVPAIIGVGSGSRRLGSPVSAPSRRASGRSGR